MLPPLFHFCHLFQIVFSTELHDRIDNILFILQTSIYSSKALRLKVNIYLVFFFSKK